jgi:hypothetical protein
MRRSTVLSFPLQLVFPVQRVKASTALATVADIFALNFSKVNVPSLTAPPH